MSGQKRPRANFGVIEMDRNNNIFFIEDISDKTGGMTVTNDAEAVYEFINNNFSHTAPTPLRWRVVYKDTEGEWWEMIPDVHAWSGLEIGFEKWHGLAWDILKRDTHERV